MRIEGRVRLFYSTLSLACLGEMAVADTTTNELLDCAAHFQARAQWLQVFDRNPVTVETFESRSDNLLSRAYNASSNVDWRMVVGVSDDRNPTYENRVHDQANIIMLNFAEDGYSGPDLPFCMEDADCILCKEMLRTPD